MYSGTKQAAMNAKQWNSTAGAFCDGICTATPHMAFHSTFYTVAFGASSDGNLNRAWEYIKSRINPPYNASGRENTPTGTAGDAARDEAGDARATWAAGDVRTAGDAEGGAQQALTANWPPPPPPGAHDGMPCGVYPAQFVLTALYQNLADKGAAALAVLTSDAKNTWVSMLKKGATMTMEMWSQDEKPNLTWSHPWVRNEFY